MSAIAEAMPLTPFHLGFAWPVWMLKRRKLSFTCLSIGAMVPDLEVLWMMRFTNRLPMARGYMHSFYGAATIDLALTLFLAYLIAPIIGKWLRRASRRSAGGKKWHVFAGVDVSRPPKYHGWALLSALVGTLSHVTIDLFTHEFNPVFWPYRLGKYDNLMPFDSYFYSSALFWILFGGIMIYMLLKYWTKDTS